MYIYVVRELPSEENNWIFNVKRYDGLVSKYLNAIKIKIHNIKCFVFSHPFFLQGKKATEQKWKANN